jgi:hypothetical protein
MPEDTEIGDGLREEDAADMAARRKAEAKAQEEAELRKRSQVPLLPCLERACLLSAAAVAVVSYCASIALLGNQT